jgi:hypothetical protein
MNPAFMSLLSDFTINRIHALPAVPKRSQIKQSSLPAKEEAVNDLLYRSLSASSGCTIRKWR